MKDIIDIVFSELPKPFVFDSSIRRAPKRHAKLNEKQQALAIANALRYIPNRFHEELIPEFYHELITHGKIYGYRFCPRHDLKAKPVDQYIGQCLETKAFQLMIENNLDKEVALYPYELITYGESGAVFQNWMQYHLVIYYLQHLMPDETLFLASGHPVGVFKSHRDAPRVILTNGLMVGLYDDLEHFNIASALGVANYGQMTAGGWMYIGPQGIVHGTYNTLLNAGRIKLDISKDQALEGKLFVSSGLGGMSGAQGKAIVIAKGVGIIAEVDPSRVQTRFDQGWVDVVTDDVKEAFRLATEAQQKHIPLAIAYLGNVVDVLEYANTIDHPIDLISDQTSCHEVYTGGYCPVSLTFEERSEMLKNDPERFKQEVNEGLFRHYHALRRLVQKGAYFFDYGNSFLKALYDAGIKEIAANGIDESDGFIWPSYVEDILGPCLFDYGYGPFRWVCLSNDPKDLDKTDEVAASCIDPNNNEQDKDNYHWIKDAKQNNLVVGSQARILYQDAWGRMKIALAFNRLVREKQVGPIMLGRDHHDTGSTDSPFRETSNIHDGSKIMADMATLSYAGNAAMGMSMIALHNGGGVGISKAINGGYGLVLDGSQRVDAIITRAMMWDVINGVARRSWARNEHALTTIERFNKQDFGIVTMPKLADIQSIKQHIANKGGNHGKVKDH